MLIKKYKNSPYDSIFVPLHKEDLTDEKVIKRMVENLEDFLSDYIPKDCYNDEIINESEK